MGLTKAKMSSRHGPFEVEGGYITVVDNRVWKGVVRRKKDGTVMWICDHIHSRPEYNARHPVDDRLVWEFSALNCGREAESQWRVWGTASGGPIPNGVVGEIAGPIPMDNKSPGDRLTRADMKRVSVGSMSFLGYVRLAEDGTRHLKVYKGNEYFGTIYPDDPTRDSSWPAVDSRQLAHWLTAAGHLLDSTWGLTFRNPGIELAVDDPDYDMVRRLTPTQRSQAKKGNPHVRPKRIKGARMYEVVDNKGKVVATLPHRGRAMKELEKLEAKG